MRGPSPAPSSSGRGGGRLTPLGDGPSPTLMPAAAVVPLDNGPVDTSSMTRVGATVLVEAGAALVGLAVVVPGGSPQALRAGFRSLAAYLRMPFRRLSMR